MICIFTITFSLNLAPESIFTFLTIFMLFIAGRNVTVLHLYKNAYYAQWNGIEFRIIKYIFYMD